jgi:hypothetical protein
MVIMPASSAAPSSGGIVARSLPAWIGRDMCNVPIGWPRWPRRHQRGVDRAGPRRWPFGGIADLHEERRAADLDRGSGDQLRPLAGVELRAVDGGAVGLADAFDEERWTFEHQAELFAADLFVVDDDVGAARTADQHRSSDRQYPRRLAEFLDLQEKARHVAPRDARWAPLRKRRGAATNRAHRRAYKVLPTDRSGRSNPAPLARPLSMRNA